MAESELFTQAATPNPARGGWDGGLQSAIDFVITGRPAPSVSVIGKLRLPTGSAEANRCKEISTIISNYAARRVSRPLSFAIFGPPGSGKSFCAEQIVEAAGCGKPVVINLSQLSDPKELAESLKGQIDAGTRMAPTMAAPGIAKAEVTEAGSTEAAVTRVFFFDEFDATLASASLGWLRWFLAPMQDGKFFLGREVLEVGKAIFMFAGGTAISLAEFEKRSLENPQEYRDKKVPDFISRLRGFIDIEGVNSFDNGRIVRRALVLHRFLDDRWPDARQRHGGEFPIDRHVTGSLLSNVHFVHGVRSLQALLDMSLLDVAKPDAQVQLPENELRKLHLSRGLLDGKIIGISAGQEDPNAKDFLKSLAHRLLQSGATLAYGGDFVPKGTLSMVIEAAEHVPDELVTRRDKRIRNYLAFPSFYRESVQKQLEIEAGKPAEERRVQFIQLDTLSESEIVSLAIPRKEWFRARDEQNPEKYNPNHHLAWAISLFRMRARLIQDIDALIVLGGKDDGRSWGRFSGIAEEVMLAIALNKPVYVLGGRGGGAHTVGQLLGLDSIVVNPDLCLVDDGGDAWKTASSDRFALPGLPDLPQSNSQLRKFLFERGITTHAWPRNGLLLEENRSLFGTLIHPDGPTDSANCVDLIIAGLLRLDWKTPARTPL